MTTMGFLFMAANSAVPSIWRLAAVNRACSEAEKLRLVEQLWRVANADSVIHKYEEHLIRRIADLLHIPHRAFIVAKLRAAEPGQ